MKLLSSRSYGCRHTAEPRKICVLCSCFFFFSDSHHHYCTIHNINSSSLKNTPEPAKKSVSIEHNLAKVEPISPNPNLVSPESAPRKEFQIYSRRKNHLGRSEYYPVQTRQSKESNPIPTALEQAQKKAKTNVDSLVEKETNLYSYLDIPIGKRKGVHSCTKHPLRYYLTYTSLSPTYRDFITSLDQIQIPNSIQEAL